LSHFSRVRVLHLEASVEWFRKFVSTLDRPAPLLESLCLTVVEPFPRTNGTIRLLSLFDSGSPRLRHVAIYNLHLPQKLRLLGGLTHLEIRDVHFPALTELHNLLSHCPTLSTLILDTFSNDAWVGEEEEEALQTGPPVLLPQLTRLHLIGDMSDCSVAIQIVSFPPATEIQLYCRGGLYASRAAAFSRLLSKISVHCGASRSIKTLQIAFPHSTSIRLQGWTIADDHRYKPFDLSFEGPPRSPHFLSSVCEGLSLTQIISLNLDVSELYSVRADLWLDIFSSLEDLQALEVTTSDVIGFLSTLKPLRRIRVEVGNSATGTLLPKLQELALRRGEFRKAVSFKALREFLMLRQENNAEIQRLSLLDCRDLDDAKVDELREIVADIVWD